VTKTCYATKRGGEKRGRDHWEFKKNGVWRTTCSRGRRAIRVIRLLEKTGVGRVIDLHLFSLQAAEKSGTHSRRGRGGEDGNWITRKNIRTKIRLDGVA